VRTNIETVADIDVISGGTDAISERFTAIESDLEQLQDSGADVAADEIAALDVAVDEFSKASHPEVRGRRPGIQRQVKPQT
jgi:hypothetical protein